MADLLVDFVARNRIHELHRGHQGNRICYRNEMGKEHIIFSDTQNKKLHIKSPQLETNRLQRFCVCLKRLVSCWTLWYTLTWKPVYPNSFVRPILVDTWFWGRNTNGQPIFRSANRCCHSTKSNWRPTTPMASTWPWSVYQTKSSR